MEISFCGMGEQLVTFEAGVVTESYPVSMTANGKVADSADGESFAGIAVHTENDGFAAVQLGGFVTLPFTGTAPALGWQRVAANGAGGIKTVGSSVSDGAVTEAGRRCLIVAVDTTGSTVDLFL